MKKWFEILIALFTIVILSGSVLVEAALEESYIEYSDISLSEQQEFQLNVLGMKKGGSYTFESSNKGIVTADKNGMLKGLKAGDAVVTCKEKYNNKVRVVGRCKITVKKAELYENALEMGYSDIKNVIVNYENPKAEYMFEAENPEIVEVDFNGEIKPLKKGTTFINVKEIYKNKTRSIGKCKITVYGAFISYEGIYKLGIRQEKIVDFVENPNPRAEYIYTTNNMDVVLIQDNIIKAVGTGETEVICYELSEGELIEVGTVRCGVIEIPSERITIIYENKDKKAEFAIETGNKYDFNGDYKVYPEDTTDNIEVFSSDTTIANVDKNGIITAKNPGEADIIIKSGNILNKCKITVKGLDMTEMGMWARETIKDIEELKSANVTNENVMEVYKKLVLIGDGLYNYTDIIWEEAAKDSHYIVIPNYSVYTQAVENFYRSIISLDGVIKSGLNYSSIKLVNSKEINIDFQEKCTEADIIMAYMESCGDGKSEIEFEAVVYKNKIKAATGKLKIKAGESKGNLVLDKPLKGKGSYMIDVDYGTYKLNFNI